MTKLTIELVPKTCWFSNVRSEVSRAEWDTIRRRVYREADYICEICDGQGDAHPVECHEVWEYDDEAKIQKLVRMIALCSACHEVKHIGFATVRRRCKEALRHLAEVNDWTAEEAEEYVEQAFEEWEERSRHQWQLDISALGEYLSEGEKT